MANRFERYLSEFRMWPPASEKAVREAEFGLGKALPVDYKRFFLECDGGEGFVGEHYLILWKADELVRFNKGYEVDVYAPGLVVFGSDGGGEGFAFDTREMTYRVVEFPFIGMSDEAGFHVADSFSQLLERMKDVNGLLF